MQPDYYTFTGNTITREGRTLRQIQATRDIARHNVQAGDIGGYIEHPENLTEESWVTPHAEVYGDACVWYQSLISGRATVCDEAHVMDSTVTGKSVVNKKATVAIGSYVEGQSLITDESVVKNCSRAAGDVVVTGESMVTDASVVEGATRLEHDAYVSHGAWVFGKHVLRESSHCMVHAIVTSELSATFTLARGESGRGLVRVHETELNTLVDLEDLSAPWVVETLRDPRLSSVFGTFVSYLDVVEFVDEFRLMRDMFAARVARWA